MNSEEVDLILAECRLRRQIFMSNQSDSSDVDYLEEKNDDQDVNSGRTDAFVTKAVLVQAAETSYANIEAATPVIQSTQLSDYMKSPPKRKILPIQQYKQKRRKLILSNLSDEENVPDSMDDDDQMVLSSEETKLILAQCWLRRRILMSSQSDDSNYAVLLEEEGDHEDVNSVRSSLALKELRSSPAPKGGSMKLEVENMPQELIWNYARQADSVE